MQEEFTRVGGKTADSASRTSTTGTRPQHGLEPPKVNEDADIERAVEDAVANKGAETTATFAAAVSDAIHDRDRVAYHEVESIVDSAAEDAEADGDTTFGATVRENAVDAAWNAVSDNLSSDLYALVDDVTTKRKDDAAVEGLASRLADKFDDDGRHRLTRDELRGYIDRAADMTEEQDDATFGETARENVLEALWTAVEGVRDDRRRSPTSPTTASRESLLSAMRETDIIAPPTDCLSPISAELVEEGLRKEFDADFYAASTRDASVHGGDPFIVEAGIAYGGDLQSEGSVDLLRFANRVPLVYQRGACATTDVVKQSAGATTTSTSPAARESRRDRRSSWFTLLPRTCRSPPSRRTHSLTFRRSKTRSNSPSARRRAN